MRARIRSVKPEALTDEDLWDLEAETGFPIFRAFVGMWMHSDREGRFEWRPRQLKTGILPYWDGDFSRVLDALTTRGFIVRYEVNGRVYGWVRTFLKHQVVNNREEKSILPEPPADSYTLTRAPRVDDATGTREAHGESGREGKGREGSGREGNVAEPPAPKRRARYAPESWTPTDAHRSLASTLRVDLQGEVAKFRDHEFASPKSDWDRAFANWLRRAGEGAGRGGSRPRAIGPAKALTAAEFDASGDDFKGIV